MNLLLRPIWLPVPGRPRARFRIERAPIEGDDGADLDDEEILVTILAMADR